MKIIEINIAGFGKHNNLNIDLSDNVNIILGDNESGKSTISTFIYVMLYGFGSDSENKRRIFRPWGKNTEYGGNILLECEGTVFKIEASFGKTSEDDIIKLYNITTDTLMEIPVNKSIGEILLGVTPEAFSLSSFASQLSSKPFIENANIDYLYDRLLEKNEEMKQSADDIAVGKRLNTAIASIGSLKNNTGILGKLRDEHEKLKASLEKLKIAKTEAAEKRAQCSELEHELTLIKDKHTSEKSDMSAVTQAVETVTLHSDVKGYVNKINKLDENLSEAVKKSKKIRKPIDIAYALVMIFCFLTFTIVFFAEKLNSISFFEPFAEKLLSLSSELSTYIILFTIAAFVSIWNMILTYIFNKPVRELTDELADTEEDLFDLLNVEYFPGNKNRQYNRDNINVALTKHKNEYKYARSVLENEDNKTKLYNEHLANVEKYTQKISYIKASIDAIDKSINSLENEDNILFRLDEISEEIKKYSRNKEALIIAREVMDDAFQQWQSDLGPKFINEAGIILSNLTSGKYSEIKVDRNFDISLITEDRIIYPDFNFSGATIDQMYLALRLSLIKILSNSENMLPIILDDPFIQYDEKRKALAYNAISSFSSENSVQIILTSVSKDKFNKDFNIIDLNKDK